MNPFGLTANIIDFVFLCFGKYGKFLNARGQRICFIIDLVCICYWFFIDVQRGLYGQAASCFISTAIAIYGYRNWKKNPPIK